MGRSLLLRIELLSDPKTLYIVRGAVERVAESVGFAAVERRSIVRAVDEALTNIMRHCYDGRLDKPIEISFRRLHSRSKTGRREGLEILLYDFGPAANKIKLRPLRPDELHSGGLGLHFIRQSMDAFNYKRLGNTNRLRLVKYLPLQKPSLRALGR